ncbi:MAG: alpha-N-acetylglucosaminidase C-terminal domain-containing protein [Phycisphaerales bacterium]|nr:MAG: alpha-N-acetylglucosaminidase C-terminal domain-containing protein [Phycisphaerales bacterium]
MRIHKTLLLLLLINGPATFARDANPSVKAAEALLNRLLPTHQHKNAFEFELIPQDDGKDVFEVETHAGKVIIRGNNAVSLATGLNWYLKHYCHCHVSWCGSQLDLPDPLPPVEERIRRTAWAKHRYLLNYCCFGYSLPWWDFSQWERLIDWMALNGVNTPLAVTGQEAVWQAVCRRLGMSDVEIAEYLAGPPYLPFQWMGCLDGWGGPLSQSWIDRHEELQKKILARQRELGMRPVLQGFTGHVPAALTKRHPDAKMHSVHWIEWETSLLDPLDARFAQIARLWHEEQSKRFGTDHLYAADTFIEMVPPKGDHTYLKNLSQAIYSGMAQSDAQAIWVLQGWAFMYKRDFWTQPRLQAFLNAIPDERMLLLDLFCESKPMWNQTDAFCGKPWLWCNVQTFGCAVRLGGALNRNNMGLMSARRDPGSGNLTGLGFVNEGLDCNPVTYDLMFEMAWRDSPVDPDKWIDEYAHYRYGQPNADAQHAWRILRDTVFNSQNHGSSIIERAPTLKGGSGGAPYSNTRLAQAWRYLARASDQLGQADTYRFDLVNVARQVLANHAAEVHSDIVAAHQAKDVQVYKEACERFLGLIRDLDGLVATRKEFLLGCWLEDAKRWGTNDDERNVLQWNARRVLTLWGQGPQIDDYARKHWSGMLAGYYLKRWQRCLDEAGESLTSGKTFDEAAFNQKLRRWMVKWSGGQETYPAEPSGDSVAVARRLWKKYQEAFKPNAVSLTTGKPTTCSHSLPSYPAHLANDGRSNDTNGYWATDIRQHPGAAWWQVDLQEPTTVGRVVVVGFYGDERYYGFTVETSADADAWNMVADMRDNKQLCTRDGYTCRFKPRRVQYIRVTQTHNSANAGRHLVEVMAFPQ